MSPGSTGAGRPDLKRLLHHDDPAQLLFQYAEIVENRTYLKHGITVDPGDVVIDAGANVGVAAAFFLAECEAGTVFSFEPVPETYRMLAGNLETFAGARTFMAGLSDTGETVEFTHYRGAAAMSGRYADPQRDHDAVKSVLREMGISEEDAEAELAGNFEPRQVTCELRTLSSVIDAEGIGQIDLLKIDVERAELDVLKGIRPGHWPRIRQVVAEVHDEDGRLNEFLLLLDSQGFTIDVDQEAAMADTGIFMAYASRT